MIKIILAAKSLLDCGQVVKKVIRDVEKEHCPLYISVINSHSTTNEIEFYNSGDTELKEVRVEILGSIKEDCFWNYSDDRVLNIPILKPRSSIVVSLLYRDSQSAFAQFKCTWKNWLNKEHSQTMTISRHIVKGSRTLPFRLGSLVLGGVPPS